MGMRMRMGVMETQDLLYGHHLASGRIESEEHVPEASLTN